MIHKQVLTESVVLVKEAISAPSQWCNEDKSEFFYQLHAALLFGSDAGNDEVSQHCVSSSKPT